MKTRGKCTTDRTPTVYHRPGGERTQDRPRSSSPAWRGLGKDPGNRQLSVSPWRRLAAQQIVELKLQHEQERTHLFQQHNAEKDSPVLDHQREIDSLG
ncbi:hypothetical protein SKAU_G00123660 [Synaphobranchus kaupii]|uniref:Uncharacterized protein n=1 Tax=Synaphobranchus kaupii TaxID=118154 RepID=A0A9Q1FP21_SYNKA|nr:hypothetical protein SKAU_G00123660 [Synaphobranchus kaupii]